MWHTRAPLLTVTEFFQIIRSISLKIWPESLLTQASPACIASIPCTVLMCAIAQPAFECCEAPPEETPR